MRAPTTALALILSLAGASAGDPQYCAIPGYLLFGSSDLTRVTAAVTKESRLNIAVVGTGSSILAGPEGPRSAYPARLEAALNLAPPTFWTYTRRNSNDA